MTIERVALYAPGDMGHAIGRVMVENGIDVVTNLADRSLRTMELADKAGIRDVADDLAAIDGSDVVLSILPPSHALPLAERLASAIGLAERRPIYVDLNAIAPASAVEVGETIDAVGGPFLDGGIIGGPPRSGRGGGPRIYISGDEDLVERVLGLRQAGLDVRAVSGGVGAASALKMCYAAITKGLTAIATQSMTAARAYGVEADLAKELAASQRMLLDRFDRSLPDMAPKAYRWVGEMEEIARAFATIGLDPQTFLGAAALYEMVGRTALGDEVPEKRTIGFTADEVARILARALVPPDPDGDD